ncbi:MAG TPA: hypothetical protein VN457_00970 [Chlamydiales bacterium]|nr:hypothetical protein [Chlamydiales bacterium]
MMPSSTAAPIPQEPIQSQPRQFTSPERPQNSSDWALKAVVVTLLLPYEIICLINETVKAILFYTVQHILMGATLMHRSHVQGRIDHLKETYGSEPLTLITQDAVALSAMHFVARDKDAQNATVVLCVGNDASVFDSKYEQTIQAYLSRGVNVMCFDYRGVGLSQGTFSENGSYNDGKVAVEYVKHLGVPHEKILIEGYSMGSGPATYLAGLFERTHLLLRCPFAKMSDVGRAHQERQGTNLPLRFLTRIAIDYVLEYDNIAKIHKVAGHVGIITAPYDFELQEERCQHGRRLVEAYRQREGMHTITYEEAAGNHYSQYTREERLSSALDEFLKRINFT